MARSWVAASCIETIVDDRGRVSNDIEDIDEATIDYLHRLLTSEPHVMDEDLVDLVPSLVSKEDN